MWYSTERDGPPQASSVLTEQLVDGMGAKRLPGHESPTYPGVVMLFPLTILAPNAWGLSVSILEPVDVETTLMRTLNWAAKSTWRGMLDFSREASTVRLDDLDKHPLESGNFQLEGHVDLREDPAQPALAEVRGGAARRRTRSGIGDHPLPAERPGLRWRWGGSPGVPEAITLTGAEGVIAPLTRASGDVAGGP